MGLLGWAKTRAIGIKQNKMRLKLCQAHVQLKLELDLVRCRLVHFSFGLNQNHITIHQIKRKVNISKARLTYQ